MRAHSKQGSSRVRAADQGGWHRLIVLIALWLPGPLWPGTHFLAEVPRAEQDGNRGQAANTTTIT